MSDFMIDLAIELHTQDNCATDYPLYLVQQKRRIWGMDTDIDDTPFMWSWLDDREYMATDATVRADIRTDAKDGHYPDVPTITDQTTDDDIDPEDYGYEKIGYTEIWVFVTAHLTKRAANRYIAENAHNLAEPRVYVSSQYRCPEWIKLMKHIFQAVQS